MDAVGFIDGAFVERFAELTSEEAAAVMAGGSEGSLSPSLVANPLSNLSASRANTSISRGSNERTRRMRKTALDSDEVKALILASTGVKNCIHLLYSNDLAFTFGSARFFCARIKLFKSLGALAVWTSFEELHCLFLDHDISKTAC